MEKQEAENVERGIKYERLGVEISCYQTIGRHSFYTRERER
jgi:hypothetical protein